MSHTGGGVWMQPILEAGSRQVPANTEQTRAECYFRMQIHFVIFPKVVSRGCKAPGPYNSNMVQPLHLDSVRLKALIKGSLGG